MDVKGGAGSAGKSDRSLMEELAGGHPEAMGLLYERYKGHLRTVVRGVLDEESELDEVLNEVLVQISTKLEARIRLPAEKGQLSSARGGYKWKLAPGRKPTGHRVPYFRASVFTILRLYGFLGSQIQSFVPR